MTSPTHPPPTRPHPSRAHHTNPGASRRVMLIFTGRDSSMSPPPLPHARAARSMARSIARVDGSLDRARGDARARSTTRRAFDVRSRRRSLTGSLTGSVTRSRVSPSPRRSRHGHRGDAAPPRATRARVLLKREDPGRGARGRRRRLRRGRGRGRARIGAARVRVAARWGVSRVRSREHLQRASGVRRRCARRVTR